MPARPATPPVDGRHVVRQVMGLPVSVELCDPAVPDRAITDALDWLEEVDARFSTYRGDSEIARLNRGELTPADAHPDVRHVLTRCEELRTATRGRFDIRAPYGPGGSAPEPGRGGPDSVDPSGYVKGWAIEQALARLRAAGARNACINGGGDVAVIGRPPGQAHWHIGIQHPRRPDRLAAALAVTDGAVATSATYARGEHIVDPLTGRPPVGLLSVTIIARDLAVADAYATTVFAMGADRAAAWCSLCTDLEAILILEDDSMLCTRGVDALRIA